MSRCDSLGDTIEDNPQEAGVMWLRSQPVQAPDGHVHDLDAPPRIVASEMHLAEASLDDILAGGIDTFSLDQHAEIAVRAGLQVTIDVHDVA
jgi:predicted XRE-type DNA-binding protein